MVAYFVAFGACSAVILVRQAGVPATRTIWAEDGLVYYNDALHRPFVSTLTSLWAGYVQIYPRLVIQIVRLFPVRDAAEVIAILGAASVAAVALFVFHAARGHIPSMEGRVLLAASVVLLPLATTELLDNIVNTNWWLLFACFWAVLWRPSTIKGVLAAGLVCFVASASDPSAYIFLPLVAARALALPSLREHAATAGLLIGLIFEVLVRIGHGSPSLNYFGPRSTTNLFSLLAIRVWLGAVTGVQTTNWLIAHAWSVSIVLGVIAVGVVVAISLGRRSRSIGLLAGFSLALGAPLFVIQIWIRGYAPGMVHNPVALKSRYAAVPILLIMSALIAAAVGGALSNRRRVIGFVALLLVLAPGWLLGFRFPNDRSLGPDWSNEVAAATRSCSTTPQRSETVRTDPLYGIYWSVDIPCGDLVTGTS